MPQRSTIEAAAAGFRPGERLYLPGGAGEPVALVAAILGDPERSAGLDIVTSAIPGINPLDLDRLGDGARVTGLFMQPRLAAAQRAGRYRHLPLSYSGFARHLAEGPDFDACLVQVAPPGPDGRCSLGAAVEFNPIAMARSRRRIGVVNPAMPRLSGADSVAYADFDLVVETDAPLRTYEVGPPTEEGNRIATEVARFIGDGAALQLGIGKVPEALLALLGDRRGLRLHTGMLCDSAMSFLECGALDPTCRPLATLIFGTASLYVWANGRDDIDVRDVTVTHGVASLTGVARFTAVNSALAVDLFGQCNGEIAAGAAVSGVGGMPDFARAARQSAGGISIVALPAAFGRERRSRIVPRLCDELVSVPRHDVDVIVTEHGSADLRGRSTHERAERLIAIAEPAHRASLTESWREIAARL